MAYYISDNSKEVEIIKKNGIFSTLEGLYNKLHQLGWDSMTVFYKTQWNPKQKSCGQCNATVLVVQEYFGGDIISYPNPELGKKGHYFNRINGIDIDLTSDQFETKLDYSSKSKIGNFGINSFSCEKSAYIIKKNLGLI